MTATVSFAPLVPWQAVAALAGIGVLLLSVALWRGGRGVFLRLAALAVLCLALMNPRIVREERAAQPDVAVIVVDRSQSQDIAERRGQTDAAVTRLKETFAALPDLDVRVVESGRDRAGGDDEGTRLFSTLSQAMTEVPQGRYAGAVLVTDGQVHDVPDGDTLKRLPHPVHALLSGRRGESDRRLVVDTAPSYGIVGKEVTIVYRVEDRQAGTGGGAARRPATVRFGIDGAAAGTAQVPVGQPTRFTLTLEHGGPTLVEIATDAAEDELSTLNNHALVAVNGVRDRLRVLLVSGQPHAGERTWRNLLKSDPSVDLVHFTILRPPDKDDFTPLRELSLIVFPVQELFEEKLNEFDLIVFDRYMLRDVLPPSHIRNIAEYVRKGGALLIAVGEEFAGPRSLFNSALGAVMPAQPSGHIIEEGFRPRLSDLGMRHPVTAALAGEGVGARAMTDPRWGRWFRQVDGAVRSGAELMRGPGDRPLLVLDRVDKGRVGQLMSDHVWLWARGYDGGGPHAELMRRLAHWLMKEPELEEEALRARVEKGQLVVERQSLDVTPPEITVTTPGGATGRMTLEPAAGGLARGTIAAAEIGLYRVDDGQRTALAASGALNPLELADLRATAERLQPAVEATGGAIAWIEDGVPDVRRTRAGRDAAGRGWMGLVRNNAFVVTGVSQIPLLPGLAVLLLVLGGLMSAWWREGR